MTDDLWTIARDRMRANGSHRRRVTPAGGNVDFDPDFSPNGRRLVFRSERGRQPPDPYGINYDALFVVNADGTRLRQINPAERRPFPASSPDGTRIVYSSVVRGDRELLVMNADGSAKRRVTRWRGADSPNAWLPDGRIVFAHFTGSAPFPRWYVVRADGTGLRSLPWLYGAADPIDWWTA